MNEINLMHIGRFLIMQSNTASIDIQDVHNNKQQNYISSCHENKYKTHTQMYVKGQQNNDQKLFYDKKNKHLILSCFPTKKAYSPAVAFILANLLHL